MPHIHTPPAWAFPDRDATPESVFFNRRAFLRALGFGAVSAGALAALGCGKNGQVGGSATSSQEGPLATIPPTPTADLYPPPRNPKYTLDRALTDRVVAATTNNFYEFTTDKDRVWRLTQRFRARPWTIEVTGLVDKPGTFDLAELERTLPMEERLYRFRCVEAWSLAAPWSGFPLSALLAKVQPLSSARYVRFVSFLRLDEAPGQKQQPWYPWPYYEGLRMDEALNELTLMVTGVYGQPLPKQHGAPVRLMVPWKYGYKSAKSIVRLELVAEQPRNFWNDVAPTEYGFFSNVNPRVPHPRWSQASEELIGTGERRPTLPFNGYGEWVAQMYTAEEMRRIS